MKWLTTNQIKVDPPRKPKKMTGTRFGAVLGLNKWSTPFATWCDITRTYSEPFEDTIYTIAGKVIEPKQADYMRDKYYMKNNLVEPADVFGDHFFEKTHGDFFPDEKIFGGMWDYILTDHSGNPTAVLEMKTSKRVEDWTDDIPEYYALQAALYAYLLGVDQVYMVASFLEKKDYDHPGDFVCSVDNTIVKPFKVHERYPHFKRDYIDPATAWWESYVERGISPEFDEKKDAEILAELRRHSITPETDIDELIREEEDIGRRIDEVESKILEDRKRIKELRELIKEYATQHFREGDKQVVMNGATHTFTVTKSTTSTVDKKALEKDGLLDKYTTKKDTYKLTVKEAE